jgi:hypothetical protein
MRRSRLWRRDLFHIQNPGFEPYNDNADMTMSSMGLVQGPVATRLRMPWTATTEILPHMWLNTKDKTLLDGHQIAYGMERSAQLDPLDVLKATVAQRKYLTSTGYTIAQIAAHLPFHGRGQRFYRKEWKEGTYDKYVTLANIEFERDTPNAKCFGYITFHGETTLEPVPIDFCNSPGWSVDFDDKAAVPFEEIVPAPPSIGTEVPVDPSKYKLKAYPYYDAPNPTEWVFQLLRDRGVLPDVGPQEGSPDPTTESNDGSEAVKRSS